MMQIANNNYNSLGKLGPHYERPEYRPPDKQPAGEGHSSASRPKGDRSTLSTKNTSVAPKQALTVPTGKLNLSAAESLVESTADLIRALPPQSTSRAPHLWAPSSMMTPVYV